MALGDYAKTAYVNGSAPGISAERLNNNENKMDEMDHAFGEYVRTPAFGPATGAVNAYTFSAMAAAALVDGMSVYLDNVIAANTGASTFNWSGLGAKAIVDTKGVALIAGKMPLNCIVGLRYNASTSSFQLLGEGGETLTGNMVAADLLAGKTGYSNNPLTKLTGTKDLTNLIPGNLKDTVVAGGVTGTYDHEAANPITAGDVVSPHVGFVNGAKVTGTIPEKIGSATVITPSTADQTIPEGRYGGAAGDGKVLAVANASAGNIKSGVAIAGVMGTALVLTVSGGNDFLYNDTVQKPSAGGDVYWEAKAVTINAAGSYRVTFGIALDGSAGTMVGRIYKNGVAAGAERTTSNVMQSWASFTEDFWFEENDRVSLYVKRTASVRIPWVGTFIIKIDLTTVAPTAVLT